MLRQQSGTRQYSLPESHTPARSPCLLPQGAAKRAVHRVRFPGHFAHHALPGVLVPGDSAQALRVLDRCALSQGGSGAVGRPGTALEMPVPVPHERLRPALPCPALPCAALRCPSPPARSTCDWTWLRRLA